MAAKLSVFTIEDEGASSTFFGKINLAFKGTYASLRVRLEDNNVIEWPFFFWNAKEAKLSKRILNIKTRLYPWCKWSQNRKTLATVLRG